jgi:hypothetical protein
MLTLFPAACQADLRKAAQGAAIARLVDGLTQIVLEFQ